MFGWFKKDNSLILEDDEGKVTVKIAVEVEEDEPDATEKQVAFLERHGVVVPGRLSKRHATEMISSYILAENIMEYEYGLDNPSHKVVNVLTAFIIKDERLRAFAVDYDREKYDDPEGRPEYDDICTYVDQFLN